MKKLISLFSLIVVLALILTGCISGKIVKASDYLANVKVLRYVSAEKGEDDELVWSGTSLDENGDPIPVPTVEEMMGSSMSRCVQRLSFPDPVRSQW